MRIIPNKLNKYDRLRIAMSPLIQRGITDKEIHALMVATEEALALKDGLFWNEKNKMVAELRAGV